MENIRIYKCIFLAFWLMLAFLLPSTDLYAYNQNYIKRLQNLEWIKEPGDYSISFLNATITLRPGEILLVGKDASKFLQIIEGVGEELSSEADAVIVNISGPLFGSFMLFKYYNVGYLRIDDWKKYIDSNRILSEIKKRNNILNSVRAPDYPNIYIYTLGYKNQ